MSDTTKASEYTCNGDYYAVGSNLDPFACEAYSNGTKDAINATAIFNSTVTYTNNNGTEVSSILNGTALKYSGGNTCPSGEQGSFTVNVYCDPDLDLLSSNYTG